MEHGEGPLLSFLSVLPPGLGLTLEVEDKFKLRSLSRIISQRLALCLPHESSSDMILWCCGHLVTKLQFAQSPQCLARVTSCRNSLLLLLLLLSAARWPHLHSVVTPQQKDKALSPWVCVLPCAPFSQHVENPVRLSLSQRTPTY